MTESEALNMIQAKLTCMELYDLSCVEKGCDRKCDNCYYNYAQGNNGEQKEALKVAIQALEKQTPTTYDVDKVVEKLESNSFITVKNKSVEKEVVLLKEAIEIVKQGGISNDVCEWHKVKNGNAYKCNTHEEIHDTRVLDWCRCPYCGKKIEVVE